MKRLLLPLFIITLIIGCGTSSEGGEEPFQSTCIGTWCTDSPTTAYWTGQGLSPTKAPTTSAITLSTDSLDIEIVGPFQGQDEGFGVLFTDSSLNLATFDSVDVYTELVLPIADGAPRSNISKRGLGYSITEEYAEYRFGMGFDCQTQYVDFAKDITIKWYYEIDGQRSDSLWGEYDIDTSGFVETLEETQCS